VQELLISIGGIIGIVIAIVIVCCLIISYIKRKKISEATRRLSETTIRKS